MNEQWVITTLGPHITTFHDVPAIKLADGLFVEVTDFVALFSSITATPTAEDLHAVDAGKLGYGPYIDAWKTEGLIA